MQCAWVQATVCFMHCAQHLVLIEMMGECLCALEKMVLYFLPVFSSILCQHGDW